MTSSSDSDSPGSPDSPGEIPGGFLNPAPAEAPSAPSEAPDPSVQQYPLFISGRLSARHRRVAELWALGRFNQAEIAKMTGYTETWISCLLARGEVKREVEKVQDKLFEKSVEDQLKGMGPDAMSVIEQMILSPTEPLKAKVDTAKWVVEMVGGKAKQKIDHDAGAGIVSLLDRLEQLAAQDAQRPQGERSVLELTAAQPEEETDELKKWVAQFVPQTKSEKSDEGEK